MCAGAWVRDAIAAGTWNNRYKMMLGLLNVNTTYTAFNIPFSTELFPEKVTWGPVWLTGPPLSRSAALPLLVLFTAHDRQRTGPWVIFQCDRRHLWTGKGGAMGWATTSDFQPPFLVPGGAYPRGLVHPSHHRQRHCLHPLPCQLPTQPTGTFCMFLCVLRRR